MTPPGADPAGEVAHRGQLRKLARRGSVSVAGAAISAVSGIAVVAIITNGFDATTAGVLFSVTSAFLIVESVVLLGTDTGLVRALPARLASGRGVDVPRTIAVALTPVVLASVVLGAAVVALAPWLAELMSGEDGAADATTAWRVLGVALPVASLFDAMLAATRGMGSMRPTVIVENIGRSALQAFAVLLAWWAGADMLGLVLAWALPYVPGLLVCGTWLTRMVRRRPAAPTGTTPLPWRSTGGDFWAYTTPRAIARVTQTALKRSDIVLVAVLASPAQAALYTAATRFVVLGQLLVQAVQQALAPHLSTLFASERRDAANAVYQAATTWGMIAAWPLYLVVATFAPELMRIFGAGYEQASDVAVVLSLSMLFATACGAVDSVLLMAGHSWLSLFNNAAALALNVALNLALIPVLGITGAAVSWSAAIVLRNVLPLLQVRRSLGMSPGTRASVWVALTALLLIGGPALLGFVLQAPLAVRVVLVAAGCVAYAGLVLRRRRALGLDAFAGLGRRGRRPDLSRA